LQGISGIMEAIATMSIAVLYDEENDGSDDGKRGVKAMFLTLVISFMAVCVYAPLIPLVPKEVNKEEQEKRLKSIEEFEALSDIEYKRLTLEEVDVLETRRFEEGKKPRVMTWGPYQDEVPEIEGMMDKSLSDFNYLKRTITANLTNVEKMEQDRQFMVEMEKHMDQMYNIPEARKEMGCWIADYFDDAGYSSWYQFPQIYKVMIMNAFPAIDELDNKKVDWGTADIEHLSLKFLKVADSHITQRRKQIGYLAGIKQLPLFRVSK